MPVPYKPVRDLSDECIYEAIQSRDGHCPWDVCEGYMLDGYLPPAWWCDLPALPGRGTSKRDRWIIAGCSRTLSVQAKWASEGRKRLKELRSKAVAE